MPAKDFLHQEGDFVDLLRVVAGDMKIQPALVEKDYWIMHCLYGLAKQGFKFELKGGTSLSKGFNAIHRFSEDIDIMIDPEQAPFDVSTNPKQTKKKHCESRARFYDWLTDEINIEGIISTRRDRAFDDEKYRSGGIRLHYRSHFTAIEGLKEGILLEAGFDLTQPSMNKTVSSWAFERAIAHGTKTIDNRAHSTACYHPGFTFVEKLQTVSKKYQQYRDNKTAPQNFLRHYYDLSQLLDIEVVQEFLGTKEYHEHKRLRFPNDDDLEISSNEAFILSDPKELSEFSRQFEKTESLYFRGQPPFADLLKKIQANITSL
jgi:predicted nucleotidyltransferase component of viral defense system